MRWPRLHLLRRSSCRIVCLPTGAGMLKVMRSGSSSFGHICAQGLFELVLSGTGTDKQSASRSTAAGDRDRGELQHCGSETAVWEIHKTGGPIRRLEGDLRGRCHARRRRLGIAVCVCLLFGRQLWFLTVVVVCVRLFHVLRCRHGLACCFLSLFTDVIIDSCVAVCRCLFCSATVYRSFP